MNSQSLPSDEFQEPLSPPLSGSDVRDKGGNRGFDKGDSESGESGGARRLVGFPIYLADRDGVWKIAFEVDL
jgi:hypothetical protein